MWGSNSKERAPVRGFMLFMASPVTWMPRMNGPVTPLLCWAICSFLCLNWADDGSIPSVPESDRRVRIDKIVELNWA